MPSIPQVLVRLDRRFSRVLNLYAAERGCSRPEVLRDEVTHRGHPSSRRDHGRGSLDLAQ